MNELEQYTFKLTADVLALQQRQQQLLAERADTEAYVKELEEKLESLNKVVDTEVYSD